MRKYGKYEKMPDGTRAKQPASKTILMQTYLTSLLCMVLCAAMFLGTTYAWFTSGVTNTGNEIYIGTLDVDLQDKDGNSLVGNTNPLFTDSIHWEPGYTALETVKVVDEGDLAFRYELTLKEDANSQLGGMALNDVAKWFVVWCYHDANNAVPAPENYVQITEANGWTKVGSLDEVLAGKVVFRGSMTEAEVTADTAVAHTYTIALHMNGEEVAESEQEAFNTLMGKSIGLNVKLVATQLSSEDDAFGNSNYDNDEIAYASNLAELQTSLAEGGYVVLTDNLKLNVNEIVVNGGILDGSGNTVACNSNVTAGSTMSAIKALGGTIKNISIMRDPDTTATLGIGIGIDPYSSDKLSEDLVIDGVTICANDDIFARHSYYAIYAETKDSPDIVVTNSALYGAIECPNAGSFTATDSTFGSGEAWFFGVSGDTSFTNCTFESTYCFIADTTTGKTITFTNCNVAGTKLTADNFKSLLVDTAWDYSSDLCSDNLENYTIIIDGVQVSW